MAHYTRKDLEVRKGLDAVAPLIPEETDVLTHT